MEQTYDSEQLLQPARDIIQKLENYLKAALKKPVYLHAVILDPCIKMFLLILEVNVSGAWKVLLAEEVKPKVSCIMCVVFLSIVHSCRRLLSIPLHCFAS